MNNPYNKETEESFYYAYEHGYNAVSKLECPYEKGTLEGEQFLPAWMKGFNEGQKHRKKDSKGEKTPKESVQNSSLDISSLSEEELLKELQSRRKAKYDKLMKTKKDIERQLEELNKLF